MPFPEQLGDRRRRATVISLLVLAALVVLAGRLFVLQVVRGPAFAELARKNVIRPDPRPALRGRIYDREGELIAGNRVCFGLSLEASHPAYADSAMLGRTVREIAGVLGVRAGPLLTRARRQRRQFTPVSLGSEVEARLIARLIERADPIPGLRLARGVRRWYPDGACAAHVVGHVGEVTDAELRGAGGSAYRVGARRGRAGLEYQYEDLLRGVDGETYVIVDAVGRTTDLFPGLAPIVPVAGADLETSLDLALQHLAEELLATASPERGASAGPPRGAVVVLDPWSGEVVVCACQPGFDPNAFARGLRAQEADVLQAPNHPLLNRAIQAGYPPGSIFKIATTLAALDAGLVTARTRLAPCEGSYTFGNRSYRCWKESGHGVLDLRGAFAQSCDVYYYQLARQLGLARLLAYGARLGLDEPTGIDLPGERRGFFPSLDWYRERLGGDPPEGNALNLAIGQGEIVMTPVGIATLVAALVSDGNVRRPCVVRRARRRSGEILWEREAEVVRALPATERQRVLLRELLAAAVEGEQGTGRQARVAGYRLGGKTGTAENPHGEDHSLFVGVAPAERPRWVAVVVLEGYGHGSAVAAPLAGRLLEACLQRTVGPAAATGGEAAR